MEQRIHGHFREAQRMVIISEKHVTFVVKIAKLSRCARQDFLVPWRFSLSVSLSKL
jgi:hypothetical protein